MICIYHNRDVDGFTSGAIVKLRYPEVKLIGYDYSEDIPDLEQFKGQEVIMIDVTFPIDKIKELGEVCKSLTIIDHHVSFQKSFCEEFDMKDNLGSLAMDVDMPNIRYIYKLNMAACEIGWSFLFPERAIPEAVKLLGEYDTWRGYGSERWNSEIYPFQFFMRIECISPSTFPIVVFSNNHYSDNFIKNGLSIGDYCIEYEKTQNKLASERSSFTVDAFGYRVLALNQRFFGSETLNSIYDENKHDILVGFEYTGKLWIVSLRTKKEGIDVSLIAKARGGGGHKKAAGYQVDKFEDIFK